jgi:hypothetical protein
MEDGSEPSWLMLGIDGEKRDELRDRVICFLGHRCLRLDTLCASTVDGWSKNFMECLFSLHGNGSESCNFRGACESVPRGSTKTYWQRDITTKLPCICNLKILRLWICPNLPQFTFDPHYIDLWYLRMNKKIINNNRYFFEFQRLWQQIC